MSEYERNRSVAGMWMDIFMKSSTAGDVERFHQLSSMTPVEINLIMMVGNTSDMLLRDFLEILKIPKSTLTSVINRLERKEYIERVINKRDMRSFGLKLTENGGRLMELYIDYQSEMGAKILGGLNEEEQSLLIGLLEKIHAYMIPSLKILSENGESSND